MWNIKKNIYRILITIWDNYLKFFVAKNSLNFFFKFYTKFLIFKAKFSSKKLELLNDYYY